VAVGFKLLDHHAETLASQGLANSKLVMQWTPKSLSSLTVPALKEKCRALGVKVSGVKADLLARIETSSGGHFLN
jgi:hypothetical protein